MLLTDATEHFNLWLLFGDQGPDARASQKLFLCGYALHHHRLLGLSWIRSTSVQQLHPKARRAGTSSGSRYALVQRVASPDDLGPEGRFAWAGLVRGIGTSLERRWSGARKAARWLGVAPPAIDEDAVSVFEAEHIPRCLARKARLADRQGSV
jgi:hypothetical protein